MPEQPVNSRDILLTLAEKLPERVLAELLPGSSPESVRQFLIGLAVRLPEQENFSSRQPPRREKKEENGNDSFCSLYTDGAARGNPGEAGAGAVLVSPRGEEIDTSSLHLGQCTNNIAEYRALIAGLEMAEQWNCRRLHIYLDSELVVRQIEGAYKVKNAQLRPLFDRVKGLLANLEEWDIHHIPRQENARADELANLGIDNGA